MISRQHHYPSPCLISFGAGSPYLFGPYDPIVQYVWVYANHRLQVLLIALVQVVVVRPLFLFLSTLFEADFVLCSRLYMTKATQSALAHLILYRCLFPSSLRHQPIFTIAFVYSALPAYGSVNIRHRADAHVERPACKHFPLPALAFLSRQISLSALSTFATQLVFCFQCLVWYSLYLLEPI